jgi:phosphoglycolate phosphatase-like HAD superfamily hydrolase
MTRLLLFDIDGTLVSGGPAKEAFHLALVEAFGTAGDIELVEFAGKTDPQIARELLRSAGLDDTSIDRGLPGLWRTYLRELEARLPADPMRALPGVRALVDALAAVGDVALGLVTGNIADGARLKLGSAGLHEPFTLGGFGSDAEERDHLPGVALLRARETLGVDFEPERVVVVGDTPRDVACGRAHGLRTVGVATGSYRAGQLEEAGAHAVLADFSDLTQTLDTLLGVPGMR